MLILSITIANNVLCGIYYNYMDACTSFAQIPRKIVFFLLACTIITSSKATEEGII